MRAAVVESWGDRSGLALSTLTDPIPRKGEVLIGIKVSGLNHLDVWVRKGLPFLKLTLPHVLGSDGAGIVERLGPGVQAAAGADGLKVGDEVIVHPGLSCAQCENCHSGLESLCPQYKILGEHLWGTNAEKIVVPSGNVFAKPRAMSWEVAGTFGLVSTTAWQMIERASLKQGQIVLVHAAASGVSLVAIQLAKRVGARVFATAGSPEKLALANKMGAERAWLYTDPSLVPEIKSLTEGRGVDVILDHVGQDLWEFNIRNLKWGGRIVTCGATSGFDVKLDLRQIFYRQLQIIGSTMGSKTAFAPLIDLVSRGQIQIPIWKTFELKDIQHAHAALEDRKVMGKIAVRVGE